MKNKLVEDYLNKSAIRIKALYFYLEHQDYADTVREAQEVVELLLKAVLRYVGVEIPKVHDVSKTIERYIDYMPDTIREKIEEIKKISKTLRKEREICFYGADDFIPSEEYSQEDAISAIKSAEFIFDVVKKGLNEGNKKE